MQHRYKMLFILFIISAFLCTFSFANDESISIQYGVEENPQLMIAAKEQAVNEGLPLSIHLPGGYFIYVLTIEEGQVIYGVIENLAHPHKNFNTATFEQLNRDYDLSGAERRYYDSKKSSSTTSAEMYQPGDSLLLIPDWTNDKVLAFDAQSGDLVDSDFIPTNSTVLSSPKEARISPWGNITISDQLEDLVQEFDTSGVFLASFAPAGGVNNAILDNIRGHSYLSNGNLVVAVGGGTNDDAIAEFDQTGNYLGNFIANGAGGLDSPFGIWIRSNDVLVSASNSDAIHRYDLSGNYLDNFALVSNFPQQVIELPSGNVAVANFGGTSGILVYDSSGTLLSTLTGITGNRGVWQLGNGNFITTNGAGVHEIDGTSGVLIRTIFGAASAQYVNLYVVPQSDPRVQLVHNAADPALDTVDVYVDDSLYVDDFAFREATPFITIPAGVQYLIGFAPSTSSSASDTIRAFPVNFELGRKYVGFATGVLDTTGFVPNPDGEDILLTIHGQDAARETSQTPGSVEFFVFHGITDVPAIDISLQDGTPLFDNVLYGDATDYITVAPDSYIVDIKDSIGSELIATFNFDLSAYADSALAVFASGFGEDDQNQNGPPAAILAAFPNGSVIELPWLMADARVQLIHNSPDPALAVVDVYIEDSLFIDDFAFRQATPFIDLPAGTPFLVGLAPANSSSSNDTIVAFPANFDANSTLIGLVTGVLNTSQFLPNPDGRDISLNIWGSDSAREASQTPGEVEFFVVHGSPDAPAVDVVARGVGTLFENVYFTDVTDYINVPPAQYIIDLYDSTGTILLAAFDADLNTLSDNAITVFASGFLDTSAANQNGPLFGLYVALANGTVLGLPGLPVGITGTQSLLPDKYALHQNYPNPFNPTTTIRYDLKNNTDVSLKIYNLLGQKIRTLVNSQQTAGYREVVWDGRNDSGVSVASGIYIYSVEAGDFVQTRKMILMK